MLSIDLTGDQRAELEAVTRQAVGRVALRAQMVLLAARGHSVPQLAAIHGCGRDVVRTWLHRYAGAGSAGLGDLPRSGRPPTDRLARRIVDAQASQSPRCAGLVQTCWTVALLAAFLAARFPLVLSCATVRRHLRATGWRWRRPRLAPASALPRKRDPDTPAKVAAIRAALRAAAWGTRRVLFLDEGDRHLLPVLRACWQQGPRLRVPTPGTNAKRAFFGARDAASGTFHSADHDRKLAGHFVAFLQRLADRYPTARLTLVMDNVAMHDAKVVRAWVAANPRVAALWLGLPRCDGHLRIGSYPRRCPMPRTHPPYPPEFRAEAVRLARSSDKSIPALAADLGVSSEALRHWLRQDDADAGRGQPGDLTTDEREELRRLRRENHVLKQERAILKKAAAFFAKETS